MQAVTNLIFNMWVNQIEFEIPIGSLVEGKGQLMLTESKPWKRYQRNISRT